MDFNALQHKLFALDPTDPAEDLRKLTESAGGAAQKNVQPTQDYVQESVEVAEGSLGLDKDYSVADFAALAGVTLTEAQKKGPAGQAKGKDPMPKAEPGRTKHPLKDKLVGEDLGAAWKAGKDNYNMPSALKKGAEAGAGSAPAAKANNTTNKKANNKPAVQSPSSLDPTFEKRILPYQDQLQIILSKPKSKQRFEEFLNRFAPKQQEEITKKKYESIKDELWAKLNEFSKP